MTFLRYFKTACFLFLSASLSILPSVFLFAQDSLPAAAHETDASHSGMELRALLISENKTILSGEIAARINVIGADMGDRFKRGEPLIVFECDLYRARLDMATSEFKSASKSLDVHRTLSTLQSVSELEMVEAETRMEIARSEMGLHQAQVNRCVIPAPFNGRLLRRIANPFEYVSPGQPLLEIIDDAHLQLQLFAPSTWLRWLKPGKTMTVRIDETGKTYSARVKAINAGVDPVSQSVELRALIDGQHPELLSGMSGSCRFENIEGNK